MVVTMRMDQKRRLLARNIETVLQDCGFTVQRDEHVSIESATTGTRRFGDLLTLAVLAMQAPFRWFGDKKSARKELTLEPFVRVFSMAASQEEKLRSRQDESRSENALIVRAMRSYVNRAAAAKSVGQLEIQMNRVWMAAARRDRQAKKLGWDAEVPRRIIGYVGAARAVMPAVDPATLLRDLLFQHGDELQEMAREGLLLTKEFEQRLLTSLQELERKGIRPSKPSGRQTRLF